MGDVDLHGVAPGLADPAGGLGELVDEPGDAVLVGLLVGRELTTGRGHQLGELFGGVVLQRRQVLVALGGGGDEERAALGDVDPGRLAVVGELHAEPGALGVHGVGEPGQAGDEPVLGEARLVVGRRPHRERHRTGAGDDHRRAPAARAE